MKASTKKLSVTVAALCAVVASASLLGACGEDKIDYASLDYSGWASIAESTWDKKDIAYQYEIARVGKGGGGSGGNAANSYLLNLYSDGTMLFWQAGLYITGVSMKDAAWVDEDRHISWDYYGFWVENEEKTAIDLYFICSMTEEGVTVQTSADWVSTESYCFGFQIGSVDGKYVLTQNADTEKALRYLNMSTNGETFPIGFSDSIQSEIKYNTLQSWVDSYMVDVADFPEV